MRFATVVGLASLALACSASSTPNEGLRQDGSTGGDAGDGSVDDSGFGGDVPPDGGAGDAAGCEPPDMLIVLDRTMSMSKTPDGTTPADTPAGHAKSKWYIAVTSMESVTAAADKSVRFGLELFPRDPGGGKCTLLADAIKGTASTNTRCEAGEILVSPALASGPAIAAAIDPEKTRLCVSTPMGAALTTARDELKKIKDPKRKQFVLFVGDGGDTCASSSDPLAATDGLSADGVGTYVVSFDATGGSTSGVNAKLLNDMACAGKTALDFAKNCVPTGATFRAKAGAPILFYTSKNQDELVTQLKAAIGGVCCSCPK